MLVALAAQTIEPSSFEVIVVDDGSDDDTPQLLSRASGVTALRQENGGPGRARTAALPLVQSPVVAFVDDDCVPTADWLEALTLAARDAPPDVGGFGGPILPLARGFMADFVQAERVVGHSPDPHDAQRLRYLVTANAAYRADLLRDVGAFDPALSDAGEDVDLSYRIRAQGATLVPVPRAVVHHDHPTSLRRIWSIYARSGAGRARLAQRHPELGISRGASSVLSWSNWADRIRDYRRAGAPRRRLPAYVILRLTCLAAFGIGARRAGHRPR